MTQDSNNKYHQHTTGKHNNLMSSGDGKWNFWFFAFVVIFIAELTFMVVLSLLFPMPGIIVALLGACREFCP